MAQNTSRPDFSNPALQVDFDDPVIKMIAATVEEVEAEPWYDGWILDIWRSRCPRGKLGKTGPGYTYNAHYKTLFEVATRVYQSAMTGTGPTGTEAPPREAAPLAPIIDFNERRARKLVTRLFD